MLRFSLKEALYKALHPLVCRLVRFQEAEVQPYDDGTVEVNLLQVPHCRARAHWRIVDDVYILSSAVVEEEEDDDVDV